MKRTKNKRGFTYIEFQDCNQEKCSIQKSSVATRNMIWLGIDDANPKILASKIKKGGTGWISYDIPKDVLLTTRMHLDRKQVLKLLPTLFKFILSGRI